MEKREVVDLIFASAIGSHTMISHFLYTLWLGTGFGAFRARVDISISRQWRLLFAHERSRVA